MTVQPKKPKTEDEFETIKRYLLECPHVQSGHPAIKAAIEGVEKEQKRQERDRKLTMKFTKVSKPVASPTSSITDEVVVVDPSAASPKEEFSSAESMMEADEWQDVSDNAKKDDEENGTSFLGRELAKIAIEAISSHCVTVKSPVAAVALVVHAAMRSDLLGFACTGIPEDETKSTGFAAPVRELPKSQFLPSKWDSKPSFVALRYRKNGTGAMKLVVEQIEDNNIQVQLSPASSKEPPTQILSFPLEGHVNLDSWTAALKNSPTVTPSLHYKSLPLLLTNFCRTYDLGSVLEESEGATPYVDNTITNATTSEMNSPIFKSDFVAPVAATNNRRKDKPWENARVPATLDQAFPMHNGHFPGGDFADDLYPGGLRDPLRMGNEGRMGGNLMGPGHPQFTGGPGMMGVPGVMGGPGSMQPRFDPMYPPGVDIGVDGNPRRRNLPSRTGQPNPDHLPPPNSFGGYM